jgi:uncharacterized protein
MTTPLEQRKRWAVLGASQDRQKFGNIVFRHLIGCGYDVTPINPKAERIEDHPAVASLADVSPVPDVACVIVPPEIGPKIVQDCIRSGISGIWFQPGAESDLAIELAQKAGLTVMAGSCILHNSHDWNVS